MRNLLLSFAAASALIAGTAEAETTVEVMHAWAGHEVFHKAIAEDFMKANPDIKIVFRTTAADYDEGVQQVIRESFANQTPDIYFPGYHLINQFVVRDLAVDLTDQVAETDLEALGLEKAMALGQVDGRQFSIPATASTPVVFVNADLVREAGGDPHNMPKDWDAFIELAAKIDALSDESEGMFYSLGSDDWMFQNLIRNLGGELMKDGKVAFNNEKGQAAIALFKRFYDEGGQNPMSEGDARALFLAGRMGMYFASTSGVKPWETQAEGVFELLTAEQPLAGEYSRHPTGGMAGVLLEKDDAAVQVAAFKYLMFMASAEGQSHVVLNTGYMPVSTRTLEADHLAGFYEKNPNWYTSVKQTPRAVPWFQWPGLNGVEIGKVLNNGMNAIAQGADPVSKLNEMAEETQALLDQ